MVKIQDLYEYIRLNDIASVQEYLTGLDNVANKLNLNILQNLLMYAIDWKRLDIIKLLIKYSGNPVIYNRWAMFYATTATNNGIPSLEIIAYLSEGQTLDEYVGPTNDCETDV